MRKIKLQFLGIKGKVYQLALNAIEIYWSPKKSPAKVF
jgi:hypothetical protein